MIRVSVFYPNQSGSRFDLDYYVKRHMALVESKLGERGLVRWEVDRGLGGGAPGAPAPYVAAGHLYFESLDSFQQAFGAAAGEIMADVPNYTDLTPQVQVSEIVS
ncbi:MAG TPA: EthD family reductase [Thermoanaerobaculia bacterium]|nr:EthD family reductase [Thermoanaerobaculia bacterium]